MKCVLLTFLAFEILTLSAQKKIMYEDIARQGIPFSKDPHAVRFENRYIMYYSVPPFADSTNPIKAGIFLTSRCSGMTQVHFSNEMPMNTTPIKLKPY